MSLGERLTKLRKEKGLSQEEVAEKLDVTRQTVSKWETDASTPDFDKIIPLCKLYNLTTDELLTGIKQEKEVTSSLSEEEKKRKRIGGLVFSIFLYFVAIAWIVSSISAFKVKAVIATSIFLLICGVATCIIIYSMIVYKKTETEEETKSKKLYKQVDEILGLITVILYLVISFMTMAWHITWIIFIIYGLISEIVKLIFMLRRNDNEK